MAATSARVYDPWATCESPVAMLQMLPTLRSVRLSLGIRSIETAEISLRTPREICVRIFEPSGKWIRGSEHPSNSSTGNSAAASRFLLFALDVPLSVQSLPPPMEECGHPHTRLTPQIIEARFKIDPQHSLGINMENRAGTSDQSDERALSSLYCGSCNAELICEGTLRRVLPLPSPFWYELADMWICHDDFKCRSEMANKTPADLRPRPGDCFFAQHHLMMHARDFVPGAIKWTLPDDDEDMHLESRAGMEVDPRLSESKGNVGAADGQTSAPNLHGAGVPRLSSSASSASSVASFSPLSRERLWEEVCCARCEGSLGEALVFSTSAKAKAASATSRVSRGKTNAGSAARGGGSLDDPSSGRDEFGGHFPAAAGGPPGAGEAGSDSQRMSRPFSARERKGARSRALHSRRQQGCNLASVDEDLWGGSNADAACDDALRGAEADRRGEMQAQQQKGTVLPASIEGLGGAKADEDPDFDYARKGGVMVILDDGTALPWPVVQGMPSWDSDASKASGAEGSEPTPPSASGGSAGCMPSAGASARVSEAGSGAAIVEGKRVQIAGLVNADHLNGRTAIVHKILEDGRACVRLVDEAGRAAAAGQQSMGDQAPPKEFSVKLEHLIPLSPEFVGHSVDGSGEAAGCAAGGTRRDRVPKSDVKLYKQWLSSSARVARAGAEDLYANHTIPRRFASEMLEIAAAHSSYKFLLRVTGAGGRGSRRPAILVQLLSWNSSIMSNCLSMLDDALLTRRDAAKAHASRKADREDELEGNGRGRDGESGAGCGGVDVEAFSAAHQVVQCIYCNFSEEPDTAHRLYARWTEQSENVVEAVDFSAEEEEALIMFLRQSTALLMPQQRLLNGLPVGFLPA